MAHHPAGSSDLGNAAHLDAGKSSSPKTGTGRSRESFPDLFLSADVDTTRIVAESPRIVLSDYRYNGAPGFLYLPERRNDIVFADYLPDLQVIATWPIWTQDVPQLARPSMFSVVLVPGKGMGLVAERQISPGELIIAERPIWVARSRLSCAADQTNQNGIFYRAAVRGFSQRSSAVFLGLANSYPPAEYDIIPGILNTNSLGIQLTKRHRRTRHLTREEDEYIACFPTLSRANHDCSPNAYYMFAPATFMGELRAAREIAAKEEITITYTPLFASRSERRASLAKTRFFECQCTTCTRPADQSKESDERRLRIRNLLQKLEDARFPPRIPREELYEVLDCARAEGMSAEEAHVLLWGSQVLTVYDELDVAIAWAKEARRVFTTIEGEQSENVRKLDDADRVHEKMAAAPRALRI